MSSSPRKSASVSQPPIVLPDETPVNEQFPQNCASDPNKSEKRSGRKKKRRQSHGSAWHWKQTDSWYYTQPGSKKRQPLYDEDGQRIRGADNKKAAQVAMARIKIAGQDPNVSDPPVSQAEWLVARVCSEYLQFCERSAQNGTRSKGHHENAKWILNELCKYCGGLRVGELKKGHIKNWMEANRKWKSPATHRSIVALITAAFNYAEENFEIPNPIKGLKRPASQPRLHSLSPDDEKLIYGACDEAFRDFLFAAVHTGLRPYCELAHMKAEDVEETPRGMMWRVYSSKTKKTRKIPVRPEVAEMTRKNMKGSPRGSNRPLFPNAQGNPWKKVTGVSRFIKVRKKLKWDKDPIRKKYSSYSCRHTFAHRMLSGYWNNGAGCSIETLAELIGDTPKVAFDHYGKEWGQHYQDPLWAALGVTRAS